MTRFSLHGIRKLDAEQVSTRVLYVLVALAVVVFGAFFRGYGLPQRLFPLTGTPCDAPGQRKSPPKGAFSWPCA